MRRCYLLLLWPLAYAACAEPAPPKIGVVVSVVPRYAAELAAGEQQPDQAGYFETMFPSKTPRGSAEDAIALANGFVDDPAVLAVVGHSNSTSSLAASQIYNAAGLVQIAPTTTAPVYSDAGPFSFRLVPSDTLQAAYLLKARRHHWPSAARIAVVHVNDDYGRGLLREVRPHLTNIVFEEPYADAADSTDIALLSGRIVERTPDLIIWLGRPSPLGMLLPELRAALPGVVSLCSDACDSPLVYTNHGGRFTGLHFVRFTNPAAADSGMRAFQERFRERTGEMASSEALLTYDAVALLRAALRDGARTRDQVRRYLESLGGERPAYVGLTGRIQFDSAGNAARTYMLAEVLADSVIPAAHR